MLVGGSLSVQWQRSWTTHDQVAKLNALLLPRRGQVTEGARRPERIVVRAVLGKATVDLSQGLIPVNNHVEVMITIISGRVELITPSGWPVVTGRVTAATLVRFSGSVTSGNVFVDPNERASLVELASLRTEAAKQLGVPVVGAVIIHVAGFGGEVAIESG